MSFADCCEYVNANTPEKLTNQIAVQSLVYKAAKAHSGLPSQLTIHAIRRVCANRKRAKVKGFSVKKFAPTSATYDSRSFSFRESDFSLTLSLLKGRERFSLHIGNYQRGLLKGQNPKSATLVKRTDGSYYLQIQLESEPPQVQGVDQVLGIDFGRIDIAVTSNGDEFNGKQITKVRDKFSRVRASLQQRASKGAECTAAFLPEVASGRVGSTRSARRRARKVLQRSRFRSRRFQTNTNHTVSYRLIQQARTNRLAIAIENLTGIRERTNDLPRSKTERRRSNSWAFFQLRMFILYKGLKFGVAVHLVDPRYTSKSCHCCGVLGNRQGKKFSCLNLTCGWVGDADENGANNIQKWGRIINLPGGPSALFCSVQDVVFRAAENLVCAGAQTG